MPALLVNPGVAVSTAAVFARWGGVDRGGIAVGDPIAAARAGRNDLQAATMDLVPEVAEVLALLEGATLARMSGSGATCFALYDTAEARALAADAVRASRPDWWVLETQLDPGA
jgi:4-diphosphocytidyl-2-C-methyl-D-erythritol kinase